jgi:hypothetical protein
MSNLPSAEEFSNGTTHPSAPDFEQPDDEEEEEGDEEEEED